MPIIFALAGLIAGVMLNRYGGWFYGLVAGLAFGLVLRLMDRVNKLEQQLAAALHDQPLATEQPPVQAKAKTPAADASDTATPGSQPEPATNPSKDADLELDSALLQSLAPEASGAPNTAKPAPPMPQSGSSPAQPDTWSTASDFKQPAWLQSAIDWLTGGNLMVRVGVVVLFFGVAFALKYAADNAMFPIELRLAGIGLGGLVMLVLGWRLREKRRGYGLVLQGGAVGVLYLTVFAALRLYNLVPPALAFGLLFAFAAFSATLAVLQNAPALAVLAAAGGFAAPILTSTGSGSHVQLFSYYLMLNLGILGIAWFRSWRALNLVGFGFTFVIAGLWGWRFYTPELFTSTEPFLVLFVLMYVAIAVLSALRQPPDLRGYVDATLVFGVPLVGFAMQVGLVWNFEYGLAWSALAAAAFYIPLAAILFRVLGRESRLLAEAFTALGLVFATLVIPLALDPQWTAGGWGLEGAAMVWIGRRQGHVLVRAFGYLLQLGAGVFMAMALEDQHGHLPAVSAEFVGSLLLALAGLFSAWLLHRHRDALTRWSESSLAPLLFVWGMGWWCVAWYLEIDALSHRDREWLLGMQLWLAGSGVLAALLMRYRDWPAMRYPALAMTPLALPLWIVSLLIVDHPLQHWAWAGWLAVLLAHLLVIRQLQGEPRRGLPWTQMSGVWLLTALLSHEAAWQIDKLVVGNDTWLRMALGLVPALVLVTLLRWHRALPWPVSTASNVYGRRALNPIGFYLWAWVLLLNLFSRGGSDPLPYVPVLNPMDISVGLVLFALLSWLWPRDAATGARRWRWLFAPGALTITLFIWANAMWFRTAHHWLGVPFYEHTMLGSQVVQSGLSILWSLCGLGAMIAGTRLRQRIVWFTGAGLMVVVVAKLFLVDLSSTGTLARIVSFIGVGGLLLVVGYFSPIPPGSDQSTPEPDPESADNHDPATEEKA